MPQDKQLHNLWPADKHAQLQPGVSRLGNLPSSLNMKARFCVMSVVIVINALPSGLRYTFPWA